MAQDWFPSADADVSPWLDNFLDGLDANMTTLHLTAADMTPVQLAYDNWRVAYGALTNAQAAAQAAREDKDVKLDDLDTVVRPLVNRIQANPAATDSIRQTLGITVRSTTRTASGVPTTRPVVTVDTSQSLRHTITFVDELTPSSRAKPDGVTGCEIWVKVGTAPTGPSDLTYLALDTRSPYVAEYDDGDAGKIAYYRLRWLSTRGESGPWSQVVSGTITA
ncbi:MAG TPA: hypothetical protein VK582_16875 [Pyrinomonadaceae bacterium]|nr:hypothetical protein [Pyrinomonadaceae bacterium]